MFELILSLAIGVGPPPEPSHGGRTLSSWMADLGSIQEGKADAALDALAAMGPRARRALPRLLPSAAGDAEVFDLGLADPKKVLHAVRQIGLPPVAWLMQRLEAGTRQDKFTQLSEERRFVLQALIVHGKEAAPATKLLIRELSLWDEGRLRGRAELAKMQDTRRWALALSALLRIGPSTLGSLIAAGGVALKTSPALAMPVHVAAVNAFGARAVPELRNALRGEDRYRFHFAAITCKVMGARVAGALEALQAEPKVADSIARREQAEARELVEYQLFLARTACLPALAGMGAWAAAGAATLVPETAPPAPRLGSRSSGPSPFALPAATPDAPGVSWVKVLTRGGLLFFLAFLILGGWLLNKKKAPVNPPPPDHFPKANP